MRYFKAVIAFAATFVAFTVSSTANAQSNVDLEKMVSGAEFVSTATIEDVSSAETTCEMIYSATYKVDHILKGYEPNKAGYRVVDEIYPLMKDECPTTADAIEPENAVAPFSHGMKVIIIKNDDYGISWLNMSKLDEVKEALKKSAASS